MVLGRHRTDAGGSHGHTPDEMHEVLKAKFIPKRFAVADGNGEIRDELVIGGSTAILNTVEFGGVLRSHPRLGGRLAPCRHPDPLDVKRTA